MLATKRAEVEIGPAKVAARNPFAADVQFAHLARGHGALLGIEHVQVRVLNRTPNRHRARLGVEGLWNGVGRSEGRGLGRPVSIDETSVRQRIERPPNVTHRQRFAAGEHLLGPGETGRILIDDRIEESGREPQGRHAITADHAAQSVRRRNPIRIEDATPPLQEGAPDLERRRIERERRGVQQHLLWSELDVVGRDDEAPNGAMGYFYPFRRARRSRRIHHIREILRTGSNGDWPRIEHIDRAAEILEHQRG